MLTLLLVKNVRIEQGWKNALKDDAGAFGVLSAGLDWATSKGAG
jgi:hypothetical protein